MNPAAALALSAAIAFGVGDFLAGIAARRLSSWWVALIGLLASVVGVWILVTVSQQGSTRQAVLWGAAAGLGAAPVSSAPYRGS